MNHTDIPLLTIGENRIYKTLIPYTDPIKWTNKHECPPDYNFNDEDWVEIPAPGYPKCSVVSPLFLPSYYATIPTIVLHNLLVFRFLNNKPHDLLLAILRASMANKGYHITDKERDWIKEESLLINSLADFPAMDPAIYYWDTLWSSALGKPQVNSMRRNRNITIIRGDMEINRKYKTPAVKKDTGESIYAIKQYWKSMGWSMQDRTQRALLEAIEISEDVTQLELSIISGLSLSTVRKYLPKK